MWFSKHTNCISQVKCEQAGNHDWLACVKDGIMTLFLNQRHSTFEPKSSRWFSFNLLMFACFSRLSFFHARVHSKTNGFDGLRPQRVCFLREGGSTGSQIRRRVCCGYKCWRSLASKQIHFTSDLRRPGRLAAAAAEQSVVRWYWGIRVILTAANGIRRCLIKELI